MSHTMSEIDLRLVVLKSAIESLTYLPSTPQNPEGNPTSVLNLSSIGLRPRR